MRDNDRTAPSRCFNGGYTGHGRILPMDYRTERKSIWSRLFNRDAA